jgi:hypothetical protein
MDMIAVRAAFELQMIESHAKVSPWTKGKNQRWSNSW